MKCFSGKWQAWPPNSLWLDKCKDFLSCPLWSMFQPSRRGQMTKRGAGDDKKALERRLWRKGCPCWLPRRYGKDCMLLAGFGAEFQEASSAWQWHSTYVLSICGTPSFAFFITIHWLAQDWIQNFFFFWEVAFQRVCLNWPPIFLLKPTGKCGVPTPLYPSG